jgi:hypothetical protein
MIVMNDESNRLYIECRPLKVLRRQEAGVQQVQEQKSTREKNAQSNQTFTFGER